MNENPRPRAAVSALCLLLASSIPGYGQTVPVTEPRPQALARFPPESLRPGASLLGMVERAHLVWIDQYKSEPGPSFTPKDDADYTEEFAADARARGENSAQVAAASQVARELEEDDRHGYSCSHRWDCQLQRTENGFEFRCEGVTLTGPDGPLKPNAQPHWIEFYINGHNVLLEGVGQASPTTGGLNDDSYQIMNHSLHEFGDAILLGEAPVMTAAQVWPGAPPDWVLRVEQSHGERHDDGTFVWESPVETREGAPTFVRTVISSRTFRPTSIEEFFPMTYRPACRWHAEGYRQFGAGIWVPSVVEREALTRDGRRMNIDRYTLQSASFNDNAHLSPWIPVGTEIHDERLTVGGHMPLYRYDGHIPSVEEVRAWASKRMGPSPRASTLGARLLFLSLAVVFGIALYRRGRTQRSS